VLVTVLAAATVTLVNARSATTLAGPPKAATPTSVPSPTPIPSVFPGPLNGLATGRVNALRRPIAVVIDNLDPDARPQSGLTAASVVFETVAEGGITRLLALYLENGAQSIGPIRSARPYFVSWAAGYDAILVRAGGSPAALRMLRTIPKVRDIDGLAADTGFVRATDRSSPHNLYTDSASIRAIAAARGWSGRAYFPWLLHKPPAPFDMRAQAQSIHITFSTAQVSSPAAYDVDYRYDPNQNAYVRFDGSQPFMDSVTNGQVAPTNVIVMFTRITPIPNDPQGRMNVMTVGSGKALFFTEGHVRSGTWSKQTILSGIRFRDARGRPVALDPGSTWIEVTSPGDVQIGRQQ